MSNDCVEGIINLNNGVASGEFKNGCPFVFTISDAVDNDVTITGLNDLNQSCEWFSPDPATIDQGSTSVTVTATLASSDEDPWYTYSVTGMAYTENVHIVVGDSMDAREKKAS